jgi:hypothetical protein
MVISGIAVDVVDLHTLRTGAVEGQHNKSVGALGAPTGQMYSMVATSPVYGRLDDLIDSSTVAGSVPLNSSEIRYTKPLPFNQWDRAKLFVWINEFER